MSHRIRFPAVPVALALALSAGPVAANGRYPFANQLIVDPSDANRIVVRASFATLQSVDGGRTWSWICEGAVGYVSTEDPWLGVTSNGTVVAGSSQGLSLTTDRGCSWGFVGGELAKQHVVDLVVERNDPSHAISVTSTAGDGGFHNVLVETTDSAATWHLLGAPLPDELFIDTIEIAPSDPRRIYVSARSVAHGPVIERSDDRGASWSPIVPNWGTPVSAWIGAVDPSDPNRVYVRLKDSSAPLPGAMTMTEAVGTDRLGVIVFDDAGDASADAMLSSSYKDLFVSAGFKDPMTTGAPHGLVAFAISPDGKNVAVGGYDDNLHIIATDTGVDQKVMSAVAGHDAPYAIHPNCLTWTSAGIFACGLFSLDLFTIAFSPDQGATFHNLLEWDNGFCLLDCPAGTTTADKCPAEWETFTTKAMGIDVNCSNLDASTSVVDATMRPVADATSAMVDAAPADAATASPPADAEPVGAEGVLPAPAQNPSGCGCRVGKRRECEPADFGAWLAAMAAVACARKSSRRKRGGAVLRR
jgi:hypothetical protein